MKTLEFNNQFQGHQGDVQIFSINEIPGDAKKIEKQFIAESEQSGSFHALFGEYDMYQVEDKIFLDVKDECVLNHSLQAQLADKAMDQKVELPVKDHRHTIIKKGKYFVGIQQRKKHFSKVWEKVED